MDSITYNNDNNNNNNEYDSAFASPQKRKQPEQRDGDFLFFTPSSSYNEIDANVEHETDIDIGNQKMMMMSIDDGWHSPSASASLSSVTWPCAASPPKKLKMVGTSSFAPTSLMPRFKYKQQDVASIFRPAPVRRAPAPVHAIIDLFDTTKNEKDEQEVLSFLAFPSLPSGPTQASTASGNANAKESFSSSFVLSPRTTLAPRCFAPRNTLAPQRCFVPIPELLEGTSLVDDDDEDVEEENFERSYSSRSDDEQQQPPYLTMIEDDDDKTHSYSIEPTMNSHEVLFPSLCKRPANPHQYKLTKNHLISEFSSLPSLAEVPTANAQDPSLELPFPAVAA